MDISVEELLKLKNINLIDIREEYKYNKSHIPGAVNVPSNYLINSPDDYLDKDKKYYLYCSSGVISNSVCIKLNYLGYNTINVIGGYNYYLLIK